MSASFLRITARYGSVSAPGAPPANAREVVRVVNTASRPLLGNGRSRRAK